MEHSHFLLALTFLRGRLRKAVLSPHIVFRVYLSNLARAKACLENVRHIFVVPLCCCFKTTPTDKHWGKEFDFFHTRWSGSLKRNRVYEQRAGAGGSSSLSSLTDLRGRWMFFLIISNWFCFNQLTEEPLRNIPRDTKQRERRNKNRKIRGKVR